MKNRENLILILDSIVDDYYLVWECFYDFNQYTKSRKEIYISFSEVLIEAYENNYINFFEGQKFDGDEVIIPKFYLTESVIKELLNWENDSVMQIRITTSDLGIIFLDENRRSSS